jgi:hypothetical protein
LASFPFKNLRFERGIYAIPAGFGLTCEILVLEMKFNANVKPFLFFHARAIRTNIRFTSASQAGRGYTYTSFFWKRIFNFIGQLNFPCSGLIELALRPSIIM